MDMQALTVRVPSIGFLLLVAALLFSRIAAAGDYFPGQAIWNQSITDAPLDPLSTNVIQQLNAAGGWGASNRFRIDYSIEVLQADASTPRMSFIPTGDHFSPDCDLDAIPVPPGGALEGESGYACTGDGDCHLIVVDRSSRLLYEMWRANIVNGTFYGGCLAVWVLDQVYGPDGRGEHCTSADAAGYPIAPLLFSADEVASGQIDHAIRFILPNARIRPSEYVHPATHTTGAVSGHPQFGVPYGARFRLRADYPLATLPNDGARTVARALQTYGMFLADGGQIALTAQSDRFTVNKWAGLLDPGDLQQLRVTDFEMVAGGTPIAYTGDCVLNPRPMPSNIFGDGFEDVTLNP